MVTFTMLTCGQSSGLSQSRYPSGTHLQNNVGNRHSPTVIAAPITSKMGKPRLPTHVCLNRQANGLSCGSVILLEQLRTIDKSRLRERVGALDTSEMKQIDWALGVSVGLAEGYR